MGKRVLEFWIFLLFSFYVKETLQARNTDDHAYGSHLRRKRQTTCDKKYQEITSGHTACLPPSSKFVSENAGVSEDNKDTIVDTHNTVRRQVSPTAKNMMKMSWDDEIANTAQRWAENCNTNTHDGSYKRYAFGRFSVGQNLASGSWAMGWEEAIKLWANEKEDYSYETNGSPTLKVVGHYTQMVWATSIKVGCGYAECGNTHFYVCNYGPGGNMQGQKPYISGEKCGDCANNCDDGLCDCEDVVCLNGGTMDPNTCKCTCTKDLPFYMEPVCGLNCTDIKDPWQCPQYGTDGCEKFTNVPQECPNMCKWCPTAAYKPEEDTSTASRALFSILGMVTSFILLAFI